MHDVEVYQKSVERAVVNVLSSKPQFFFYVLETEIILPSEGEICLANCSICPCYGPVFRVGKWATKPSRFFKSGLFWKLKRESRIKTRKKLSTYFCLGQDGGSQVGTKRRKSLQHLMTNFLFYFIFFKLQKKRHCVTGMQLSWLKILHSMHWQYCAFTYWQLKTV